MWLRAATKTPGVDRLRAGRGTSGERTRRRMQREQTEPTGHPSRWCGPARRRSNRAMSSARWWPPRRIGETFSRPRLRAFLGDGGSWIWTLHKTYFPTFEPIVDFVHVLTYVYLAAKAVGGSAAAVWERYLGWATACWQGRVATVLEAVARDSWRRCHSRRRARRSSQPIPTK